MVDDSVLSASDRSARSEALDVTKSFIVQAPAGSGKTELLIQRYLRLLAIVKNPEEVVAITFTRKAAAEMRLRALAALQNAKEGKKPNKPHEIITYDAARAILDRERKLGWNLTEFPHRMRIQTMDGLNTGIARSLPLSSALGGVPTVLADAEMTAIYEAAAAATFDWLVSSNRQRSAVDHVLKHLDNNTGSYVDHVARMLQKRDQWLAIVGTGELNPDQARIVRDKLEQKLHELVTQRLEAIRMQLPVDLGEQLVGLANYAGRNLRESSPDHSGAPLAELLELPPASPEALANWLGIAELLLIKSGAWRKGVNVRDGFPAKDNGEKQAFKELLSKLTDLGELCSRLHGVRQLPPHQFSEEQWAILLALFKLLPLAVYELKRLFAERGVVDHVEVALAANRALGRAGDPGEMALLLDHQINHLLVDEMQDTSISQYRMLEKLVQGWQPDDGRTFFCVGDPMQSIYRFRDAEVGQFLIARDRGIGDVKLASLLLRRNFRSGEHLVHWFNGTFRAVLPPSDDVSAGAISYADAAAVRENRGQGEIIIHPVLGSSPLLEADTGVGAVQRCLETEDQQSIAILVRSRTHLPTLLAGLRNASIDYHAVEIDRLTDLPEITDVLALTRALCHLGDRTAWLGLLRGPWAGLPWADIHKIVVGDSRSIVWDLIQRGDVTSQLSDNSQRAVTRFIHAMKPFLAANATQSLRHRVETAWFALGGPAIANSVQEVENIYRFLDVVEKFETAGTMADPAGLESLLDEERVSNRASANCRVQVLTIHKAKGLEFDHVILYGLGRVPSKSRKSVLNWMTIPGEDEASNIIISPIGARSKLENDPLHQFIESSDKEKERHEQDRLLYVACTRARKSLHLIGHTRVADDGPRPPPSNSLLCRLWPSVQHEFDVQFAQVQRSVQNDSQDKLVEPVLRRFSRPWKLPEAPELPVRNPSPDVGNESGAQEIEYYWVGSNARHAGTIVHRWLQKAADGSVNLEADDLSKLRPVNERWSERLGVPRDKTNEVCDRVEDALLGILSDSKGRWTLYGEGHAELPVTGLWNGRLESIVIDRVRIDEDGVHWIVDYKTSTHEGGDLEGFLEQESERYRSQLQKYAALYSALGAAPIRAALYFPLLQEFREVKL